MGQRGRERQLRDFDRTAVENQYVNVLREAAFSRGPLA